MKSKIIYILLCSFALCTLSVKAQEINSFSSEITELIEKYKAVGLAFVVVKDNKIIHTEAIGYKNAERGEKLEINNLFRIASISKSFTATAIMQLVEQGKISLDDDFSELIGFPIRNPKFPNTVITLRMVLSHTSSINDKNGYFDFASINPLINKNWDKSYNDYEPGTDYQYCNLNFNMAGAVLERLTGTRFDEYIKKQILDPLQLNAGYNVNNLDSANFATIYEYGASSKLFTPQPNAYNPRKEDLENYVLGVSTPVFSPTGGMKISALDLAKYMMMHQNYGKSGNLRIISKKSAKKMQTPVSKKKAYGLALEVRDGILEHGKLVGHTGSAYGLYSSMFFNPKKKFGFVVITNGCIAAYDGENLELTKSAIQILYKHFIVKR
ncbi:serine hydrolase domain-containing protein [Sphingobacterium hungaricum]|uniref:Serine hydrolase n=1 Tax=Sphingobacterium hungaricum TaxID=2082723 RepID=A0A928YS60_9SPHI|nr:serine hydrolase domain-containing protein [Sphingobacterium hungaricum]MBE8714900.1 serine hydrolase [Sphingobacterium hungaricum]